MESYESRYRCVRCGACCRWAGYVWLTDAEVDSISACLELSVEEFTERYTRLTSDHRGLSLIEKEDDSCVFLSGTNECDIYAVRPQQCRGFPNRWRFPGFEERCRAQDTWQEDEGEQERND